ncbi:hypothetical protein EfmJHP38_25510 [Enterococcus faecium]|nr:hypothetical protein EfmJHP38_25510 [Enterococcus faecium]
MKTQYPMIPFPLIVKATDGDTEAINQILHHYRGYITKRSLRLMKDEYGNQSMVVDEVLRGRMETRLITKILSYWTQISYGYFEERQVRCKKFPNREVCYSTKAY